MLVSVVCESSTAANVNAAMRDSSSDSHGHHHGDESLQSKLVASTKRVLLTKIDTLKSKCIVLKSSPKPPSTGNINSGKLIHIPAATTTSASSSFNKTNGDNKDSNQSLATNDKEHINNASDLPHAKHILFPRESVQIGWKNSGRKWNVGSGMSNVGNSCYLNSTLQALFHVPSIANWLTSDTQHMHRCEEDLGIQGSCIICCMSKTLLASQNQQSCIRPYMVYDKLKTICRHLTVGRQEDAHEFLRYLVEAMEKAYLLRFRHFKDLDQISKETTPLNQILGGYIKSAVRCLACGYVSNTFQHFEDLLLDICKADTIDEALEGYFSQERLENMGYKCESCKKKVSATKQFTLERAPIALCIQLKRFSMLGTKINKQITMRPRLNLSRFASKNNAEQLTYKLVAMVTHLGASQNCGHYTAIGLTESGTYYSFDDRYVRPISLQNVVNTNAYILFYELEHHNGKKAMGPQLPKYYKNANSNGFPGNGNKLVNTPTKVNNRPNTQPSGSSKIMIHFKNSPANSNVESNATATSTISSSTSSTDKLMIQSSESDEDKVTITSNDVSFTTTLPHMPKLELGSPVHLKEKSTVISTATAAAAVASTGLWQVTNVRRNSSNSTTQSTSDKKDRNHFAAVPSASPVKNRNANPKPNNFNSKNGLQQKPNAPAERSEAVNKLLKQSHRGYGAPVLSRKGNKTELEKEVRVKKGKGKGKGNNKNKNKNKKKH